VRFTLQSIRCGSTRIILTVLAACCCLAADDPAQPPVKGRPLLFSGIIGKVDLAASATPTELPVEGPLIFKLRLKGPPALATLAPPDLRKIKGFDTGFAIRLLTQRWLAQEQTREFEFELRPKHLSVEGIPPVPFIFYVPGAVPPERGYQTRYTDFIALRLSPRQATPVQDLKIENIPESLAGQNLRFDFSPAALTTQDLPWAPNWVFLVGCVALPPVLIWIRLLTGRSRRKAIRPECSQVLEFARQLSSLNRAGQNASEEARLVLDSNRTLLLAGVRTAPHGPWCECREFLTACQAYFYGGRPGDSLQKLIQEAGAVANLEQREGQ
jgi:hypothetical protein